MILHSHLDGSQDTELLSIHVTKKLDVELHGQLKKCISKLVGGKVLIIHLEIVEGPAID